MYFKVTEISGDNITAKAILLLFITTALHCLALISQKFSATRNDFVTNFAAYCTV